MELGLITETNGAALIAAGLLSVLLFPLTSLRILGGGETGEPDAPGGRQGGMPLADAAPRTM